MSSCSGLEYTAFPVGDRSPVGSPLLLGIVITIWSQSKLAWMYRILSVSFDRVIQFHASTKKQCAYCISDSAAALHRVLYCLMVNLSDPALGRIPAWIWLAIVFLYPSENSSRRGNHQASCTSFMVIVHHNKCRGLEYTAFPILLDLW